MRSRVPLVLRRTDNQDNKIDEETTTENVSLSGFLCISRAELPPGSVVEVYLTSPSLLYVGKAKNVHSDTKAGPLSHYGFRSQKAQRRGRFFEVLL